MERNPYLILGIPFGASREAANVAFVRKARLLRRGGSGPFDMADLTWALNQVDEGLGDPSEALGLYRVPADPGAFTGHGPGVLHPLPERLSGRGGDRAAALETMRQVAAQECLRRAVLLHAARSGPVTP